MHPVLLVILVVLGSLQIAVSLVVITGMLEGDGWALLPADIRTLNDLTWFGAIFLFILLILIIPYVYLWGLLRLIFKGEWF